MSIELRGVLAHGDLASCRAFARAQGMIYQTGLSGIDLVVELRQLATAERRNDLVGEVDLAISGEWQDLALALCANTDKLAICRSTWARALAVLTTRFPSPIIHQAFTDAMMTVSIQDSSGPLRVSTSAELFTPVWHDTIDRADSETLYRTFSQCRNMFGDGDFFVGYARAWRFGLAVASRYASQLAKAYYLTPTPLPLGSDDSLQRLSKVIARAIHLENPTQEALDDALRSLEGPLAEWGAWLSVQLCGLGLDAHYNEGLADMSEPTGSLVPFEDPDDVYV